MGYHLHSEYEQTNQDMNKNSQFLKWVEDGAQGFTERYADKRDSLECVRQPRHPKTEP